jgi:4-hydroxyproline epimerase
LNRYQAIDSHTGGEPTRVVFGESLGLQGTSLEDKRQDFATRFDHLRSGFVCEPRGSDIIVGALLIPGTKHKWGVIFFNNVGMLNMCGHGTIGVAETLRHLGEWNPGDHTLETPVGDVNIRINPDHSVEFANVPSYRESTNVAVQFDGKTYTGDVAWGGNWFFLCQDHNLEISLSNLPELMRVTTGLAQVVDPKIDHIELVTPIPGGAMNFVLCPGLAYDRSPCGTGTSAKLACLLADGKINPGEIWRQESVTGSSFDGWVEIVNNQCIPHIRGRAHITAELTLIFDPLDPLKHGFTGAKI